MIVNGWRIYNHAAIPATPPHETPDTLPIENGSIWKMGGVMLSRWTTEFDCGHETSWWYVIKDTEFDISKLKAKRRYEIKKGIKHFDVKKIVAANYAEELYSVQTAAYSAYPKKYRPSVDRKEFISSVQHWDCYVCIGVFERGSEKLCGYALLLKERENYVSFRVMKTNPEYEKNGVNAALVEGILRHFNSFLTHGGYICDGERSINHETAFQDYLEKYFGFRKAYCKLHITYNPKLDWMIRLIYPFRWFFIKLDKIGIIHQVNAVLRMEEIVRKCNE